MALSKKAKRTLLIAVAVVVAVPILVLLVVLMRLGTIIKIGVEKGGPMMLGVETRLDDATVLPFSGKFSMSGLSVGNPEGFKSETFLKAATIRAGADITSFMSDTIHIREIVMDGPEFTFEQAGGKSNVGALLDRLDSGEAEEPKPDEEEPAEEGAGKKMRIDLVRITNAKVHVVLLGQEMSVTIPNIEIHDIGGDGEEGASPKEVVKKILTGVAGSLEKAVEASAAGLKDLGKNLKDLTGDAGSSVKDAGTGVKKSLKGLLGK